MLADVSRDRDRLGERVREVDELRDQLGTGQEEDVALHVQRSQQARREEPAEDRPADGTLRSAPLAVPGRGRRRRGAPPREQHDEVVVAEVEPGAHGEEREQREGPAEQADVPGKGPHHEHEPRERDAPDEHVPLRRLEEAVAERRGCFRPGDARRVLARVRHRPEPEAREEPLRPRVEAERQVGESPRGGVRAEGAGDPAGGRAGAARRAKRPRRRGGAPRAASSRTRARTGARSGRDGAFAPGIVGEEEQRSAEHRQDDEVRGVRGEPQHRFAEREDRERGARRRRPGADRTASVRSGNQQRRGGCQTARPTWIPGRRAPEDRQQEA